MLSGIKRETETELEICYRNQWIQHTAASDMKHDNQLISIMIADIIAS